MTELTLHMHVIEQSALNDAEFNTISIALNRHHMAHLAHLYAAARALKADVGVHHFICETELGGEAENTITITPCGEIECEFADPVPNDWPILLTKSGYLTMEALVKAYTWAQQQGAPCSAFIPRGARSIYLVSNETLIADPEREALALQALALQGLALQGLALQGLDGSEPANLFKRLTEHEIEQPLVSHPTWSESYQTANPLWPNDDDTHTLDLMIEQVSGAEHPSASANDEECEATLRNYQVGITRTAYSQEAVVEVVAFNVEDAEQQALKLAADMEFNTTAAELNTECVELGTIKEGETLVWTDPDTEQECTVTFKAVSGDVVRCAKSIGDPVDVSSHELSVYCNN